MDSSVNKKGSAVAVTPTNDGGKEYNDNSWHQIIATRIQALGNITIDGQYTGNQSKFVWLFWYFSGCCSFA